jgi:Asp-tRNA(Asn)/Glu-tRNA(Gln) amidotransferase A subunit family amidase
MAASHTAEQHDMRIDRRTFIAANIAFATKIVAAAERLVTFSDWMRASRDERRRALPRLLDHITKLEPDIQAWVQLKPQPSIGNGALAEIPFAVKDIIETKGLATEYGSPVYKGRLGTEDAAIVRDLRGRGAVMLGKAHTTAFAYRAPAPTRNPRNREHTPGGSSSGSAAAVAAGMVPFALGTQTGGSVLRPASFCGVTGFKATYGSLPLEGVLPLAPGLDTLGFFTHTAADMLALWEALGKSTGRVEKFALAIPDPLPEVDPPMATALRSTVAQLRRGGMTIQSIDIAGMLTQLAEANATIMAYEAARVHQERFKEFGDRLGPIADLTREGLAMPVDRYDAARRYVDECRKKVAELLKATPVILTPAAPGPAPRGLDSTGDARMNRPWTTLGTPAVSIPMPVGPELPLGLQLAAAHGEDARVLRTAVVLEEILRKS